VIRTSPVVQFTPIRETVEAIRNSSSRLRIAQVAPLFERVPPALYGGTERVVAHLTDELVGRGHHVTLFATADSGTAADLAGIAPNPLRPSASALEPWVYHVLELSEVFERAAEFDIIHCHVDFLAFPFGRLVRTPTVHTLHGRLDLPFLKPLFARFRDIPLVSISNDQRLPLSELGLQWVATTYHGLPLSQFAPGSGRGGYVAFLGRICPEKRPDLAIQVARRVGLPLKIAAKVDPVDRAYFEREICPLLRDPLVEFVGEIGDADKSAFLGDAVALLFPVDWPEPFGLVMIEALACGTPVIARPRGAVPEIIEEGVSGFLADTVEGMAAAVRQLDRLDRARCRERAEARFSVEAMADRYEAIYRTLAAGVPTTPLDRRATGRRAGSQAAIAAVARHSSRVAAPGQT
jgi:glycosyltransferase involved in cell wall biosynthesis